MTAPTYRYRLERDVAPLTGTGTVLFIMLNPSTADETVDDPTIRRCMRFAESWGFRRMLVGNLFAMRATNPRALATALDPIGPENDVTLCALLREADQIVYAWGAHPIAVDRANALWRSHPLSTCPSFHLGITRNGQPRHPLYVPAATRPVPFAT